MTPPVPLPHAMRTLGRWIMRAVLLAALVLALPLPATAQGLEFSVRGGVSLAELSFEADQGAPDTSPRIGLTAGGAVTVPLADWLQVQVEAFYTQKGTRLDFDGIESSVWLDYVEVPVLARVPVGGRAYLLGGAAFGARVRARSRTTFGGATEEIDLADDVTGHDVGVVGGGGLEFGRLIVDVRYTLGLVDVDVDQSDSVRIRNRALAITAGVTF